MAQTGRMVKHCELLFRGFVFLFEIEGSGVDAVSLAGGGRAVVENVAEMAAALGAVNLDTVHPMTGVPPFGNGLIIGRC